MKRSTFLKQACLVGGGTLIWMPRSPAHEVTIHSHGRHHDHWITPHVRPLPRPNHPVEVEAIDVKGRIEDQVARTTMTITMRNPGGQQAEGSVLLPVPHGAILKSFRLEGAQGSFEAEILPREEARRIYNEIVSRLKDPAILEFAGFGALKSSVFPVPANGVARLRLEYEELLPVDAGRIDYVLPRSESLETKARWSIDIDWSVKGGIATLYSPSHELTPERRGDSMRVETSGRINPGPFRLSVLRRNNRQAVATFLSHPNDKGDGGWFLCLVAPPEADPNLPRLHREVTLVLDRSGSMAGEKLDQARAAALQVVEGLEPEDHFNLIIYNEAVSQFAEGAVPASRDNVLKARRFIQGIRVSGGTNIHGALKAAIAQPPVAGTLPIVLFLTDGLPTIGETSEKRIREDIRAENREQRRIFTFGVGLDVNTPLLSRLADDTRATASFVLPREKVELKVAQVFRRLSGPVLAKPELIPVDKGGQYDSTRVDDVVPHQLPDFFADGQAIVTGRYLGTEPLHFRLSGHDGNKQRLFFFPFHPAGQRDPFVPRLWATRKIAVLTEALRDLGADSAMHGLTGDGIDRNDPRIKELVDEIVRLSTEHGILTEYTAFLARDGEVFRPQAARRETARDHYIDKAMKLRSGAPSVNQDWNLSEQKSAASVNPTNRFLNADLEQEEVANVQQSADTAFYKRGDAWIDSRVVAEGGADVPVTEIAIGSKDFEQLVDKLVASGRQSCLNLGTGLEVVVENTRYRLR